MPGEQVVVIGAGLAGLCAGMRLAQQGHPVLVAECMDRPGGMLRSLDRKGYSIEQYYHHFFISDHKLLGIIRELGLDDRVVWRRTKTAFLYDDGIHDLSKPTDILRFGKFSLYEKVRFISLMLRIKFARPEKYQEQPVDHFLLQHGTKGLYDKFFFPMLRNKLGNNLGETSASWFIERMKKRTDRGPGGERLGYLRGGFSHLIDHMAKAITDKGGRIMTSSKAGRIRMKGGWADAVTINGKLIKAKAVISTVSPNSLNRMLEPAGPQVPAVKEQGALCVLLGLKKGLTGFYWTNVVAPGSPFGAIVEHTNFMPLHDYGEHVVYLASYPDPSSRLWTAGEGDVFKAYLKGLMRMFPGIKPKDVNWHKVVRDRYAGIVYQTGLDPGSMSCRTSIPNLFVGGMFNSYPERGIEESLDRGEECAKLAGGL